MYCKCTKGSNYKVIGECDPSKFDQEMESAWIQITVPEILPLPECYPDIEDLERIYVNVIIESARVIATPSYNGANLEGQKVTGRKVVVDGNICQTIVYTADNCEQSLHSINFKFPFCTSIVVDKDTDIENDTFCIETCIENVYAKALNPRTIFKNITLFLLAEPSSIICSSDRNACVNIENTKSSEVNFNVLLKNTSGEILATKKVSIAANAKKEVCFEGVCDGDYVIEFHGAGLTFTPGSVNITVPVTEETKDVKIS